METYYIPIARITPGSIVTYSLPTYRPHRTKAQEETEKNPTRGKFNGVISDKSRRKLKRIAEQWLGSIQEAKRQKKAHRGKQTRYVTFVTLTLSAKQMHSDNEIKRELLNPFIITAIRQLNVKQYLWRAEAQENGNIHFHLFMDAYIPHQKLRVLWNSCQERLGYISRFKAIHSHTNPNSTDIERIKSPKGASIYVTKYISKESKYRKLEGRCWGCSDGLKAIKSYEVIGDYETNSLIRHAENTKGIKKINGDNYTVHIGDISQIIALYFPLIQKEINAHKLQTYQSTYP
jgi:hypothetical protein